MLQTITDLSRKFGADESLIIAGGGNTSCKDDKYLFIKPSGVSLASIKPEDFVKMDRSIIRQCFTWGEFADKKEREERVKKLMAYAVTGGDGRPSVEAPLHEIMPFKYIVHTHPVLVNGMTCGEKGKEISAELFPGSLWIDYCDPGYTLAREVYEKNQEFMRANGKCPQVIFLQNHGVFVGADDPAEIEKIYADMLAVLKNFYAEKNVSTVLEKPAEPDMDAVCEYAPLLRGWLGGDASVTVSASAPFAIARGPLTPDHMVYAKSFGLVTDAPSQEAVNAFKSERGYLPRMVEIPGKAVFCAGKNRSAAETVRKIAESGSLIAQLAAAFGGVRFLNDAQRSFIENWEVESYRSKVAAGASGSMTGMIAVVTGGAQGFGFGIAQYLAKQGADVVIADMNAEGAAKAAATLGAGASGLSVNVGDEASVEAFFRKLTALYGGCDLFVANAGVVRAGSVKSIELKDWKFVTDVNYIGYFLCVKHCARLMAKQNAATGRWTDIVQVNSKSGLVGSKANGAYAGSKFGSIGLTQSFALELIADKIKINSVCPGNFFDGPLWSDPVKGLFVQYLNAGKVPGAKTTADVKKHYESLIPMHRGCTPDDVAKAICYSVIQKYETGQAIPVTGGQVMLN